MNTIWSKYVQGTKTLYYSRKLRFDDLFSEQYRNLFGLDAKQQLKILEIGCGPGRSQELFIVGTLLLKLQRLIVIVSLSDLEQKTNLA